MATKTRNRRDPLGPQNVLRGCRWPITTRYQGKKIVNPCNVTYDSRTNSHQLLHAVTAIVRIIKIVLPLAAAAQNKECTALLPDGKLCGRALPWAREHFCEACVPRSKEDKWAVERLERKAEAISGVKAPKRGWSLSTEIL